MWDSRVFGFQSLSLIELKFLWNCLVDFVILVQGVVCICQLPGKFRSVKNHQVILWRLEVEWRNMQTWKNRFETWFLFVVFWDCVG